MDIQRVKATVKKITRLLDQINEEASAIEKDLVLDYLREAYDLVLESNPALPKEDHGLLISSMPPVSQRSSHKNPRACAPVSSASP